MTIKRTINNYGTHGDVQIKSTAMLGSKPDFDNMQYLGHNILAEGEVTGHLHALDFDVGSQVARLQSERGTGKYDLYLDQDGNMWADIRETVALSHQEHNTVYIEPGAYQISITREYNPFLENIQYVAD